MVRLTTNFGRKEADERIGMSFSKKEEEKRGGKEEEPFWL